MATVKDRYERDFRLVSSANRQSLDFNKIKVGKKTLSNDVTIDSSQAERLQNLLGGHRDIKQKDVKRMLEQHDIKGLRAVSRLFFETSGIYSRLCRYMAYLYRYDWFVTPIMYDSSLLDVKKEVQDDGITQKVSLTPQQEKVVKNWYQVCRYLENSRLKRVFGDIALKVIVNGSYYGFVVSQRNASYIQELPPAYCRSRYEHNGRKAVEFNVRYFDDMFHDVQYRVRVLKMFPKDIQKAYLDYKKSKLPKDYESDDVGWYLLDDNAIKFNLSNDDAPLFATVIPKLMDLEDAQGIDKKKMLQQILRVVIQKLPIDKNGDLIFDVDEAQQLHSNAVQMLSDAIGVDVLTTFADVTVEDMADNSNVSSVDQLDKVERTVYNEAGTGQNLFNSDGNLSLQYSISNDEATMTNLVLQFEEFAESLLGQFNKTTSKREYRVNILPTTVYNYKDLSTQYKELTAIGFSKVLPQVALGQPQSTVIMTAYFENNLLDLNSVFTPPQSANTTSGNAQQAVDSQNPGGRPALEDDEQSDKTRANRESNESTGDTSDGATT